MPLPAAANNTRLTGPLTETLVSSVKSNLQAILPDATTAGVITIKDDNAIGGGSTAVSTSAAGLTQQGKFFGPFGVLCLNGITVTLAGADTITLVWTPI